MLNDNNEWTNVEFYGYFTEPNDPNTINYFPAPNLRGGDHREQHMSRVCLDKEHEYCFRQDCRCYCHVPPRK